MTQEVLAFHEINDANRRRLIDWIVQVLRALKQSEFATLFSACRILDAYLFAQKRLGVSIGQNNLYLLGMVLVLISSKFEDVEPIQMKTLIEKAGFFKFSAEDMLQFERDLLQAIQYKIFKPSCHFNETLALIKGFEREAVAG